MKYIFLIGVEHQLFQVNNAISHFGIEAKDIVLIIEKTSGNQIFINKYLNSDVYGEVIVFESWTFIDLIKNTYKYRNYIDLCMGLSKSDIIFFASHYDTDSTLLFNSIVKPKKYFLMDEGTASFSVQIQRDSYELVSKLKFFIKSLFYKRRIRLPSELTYFTRFELTLLNNDYKEVYKVARCNNALKSLVSNELIFIGTSIVELKMADKINYIRYLDKVKSESNKEITKFYYYPHRNESEKKLAEIIKLGYEVVNLNEPFENFFSKQVTISSSICSFYTTSVIYNIATSNTILPKLIIYKFDKSILKKHRLIYENIYNTMKMNKLINFLEL